MIGRLIVAAVVALVVLGCFAAESDAVIKRFRVDAEVEKDGRRFTASQVWETEVRLVPQALPDIPWIEKEVRGEALAFSLSDQETLFLLRRGPSEPTGPGAGAWILQCIDAVSNADFMSKLEAFSGGCDVEHDPMFALASGTVSRPSLALVDGTAVKLISLGARVTEEPITTGLPETYPWIRDLPNLGKIASSHRLYQEDLSTEVR